MKPWRPSFLHITMVGPMPSGTTNKPMPLGSTHSTLKNNPINWEGLHVNFRLLPPSWVEMVWNRCIRFISTDSMMRYPSTYYRNITLKVSSGLQIESPKKAAETSAKQKWFGWAFPSIPCLFPLGECYPRWCRWWKQVPQESSLGTCLWFSSLM